MKLSGSIAALFLCSSCAWAADYPAKPINFVVPFTPGSTTDITARAIANAIAPVLGQPIVIENKPGASGTIGMQHVARSAPDGYTLVVTSASGTAVPPALFKSMPYDLLKDMTPVSLLASTPLLLVARHDSPINTVPALIELSKAQPEKMTYGDSAGLFRLAMEQFKQQAGVQLTGVPYKGPSAASIDLIGGRLTVMPDSMGAAMVNIQSGRIKPLAILSGKRIASLKQTPTMLELGYKGFDFNGWIGLLAPAGTPDEIIQKLNLAVAGAVKEDSIKKQFSSVGIEPVSSSSKEYGDLLRRDIDRYQKIADAAGIARQ
ncbi:LacI family transcriptional regulator [Advenella kashmirensis W13003]|uniref:LacI family transcriptional regulator n=1 Tax=Advenella kashmirensis W13003 TaxID=1424334 RepID=V8QWM6_9BURK|nr:tripartite tricarboxylate transporter substrate binding protein [Advenella kashmirensis]ETF03758.1 LacI family transcriptional regulator [Advenella kashmirensis W13003]